MKVRPLGLRVIIEPEKKEEKTKSGIYLPEGTSGNEENRGTVVAISEQIKESPVKTGDVVLYEKYGGKEISDNEKKYVIQDLKDIIAVIKD